MRPMVTKSPIPKPNDISLAAVRRKNLSGRYGSVQYQDFGLILESFEDLERKMLEAC